MKRTPLKRKTPLSPVSKNKEKRAKRFIPKHVMEALKARSGGICEVWDLKNVNDIQGNLLFVSRIRCQNDAVDPHHILPRGRGGKHELNNLLHVCRSHHIGFHRAPAYWKKLGYIK